MSIDGIEDSPAIPEASFDHEGISPHRICERCLVGSDGFCRMTRNRLRGSDIVPRCPVLNIRDRVEVFRDDLLPARQSVTPTHGAEIMTRNEKRGTAFPESQPRSWDVIVVTAHSPATLLDKHGLRKLLESGSTWPEDAGAIP